MNEAKIPIAEQPVTYENIHAALSEARSHITAAMHELYNACSLEERVESLDSITSAGNTIVAISSTGLTLAKIDENQKTLARTFANNCANLDLWEL